VPLEPAAKQNLALPGVTRVFSFFFFFDLSDRLDNSFLGQKLNKPRTTTHEEVCPRRPKHAQIIVNAIRNSVSNGTKKIL